MTSELSYREFQRSFVRMVCCESPNLPYSIFFCSEFIQSLSKRIQKVRERFKMNGRELLTVEKQLERITVSQLVAFCDFSREKYQRAKIEPGTKT